MIIPHTLVAGVSGAFYVDCNPALISSEHYMLDELMAFKLWVTAEEMTAGYLV